jgi:putative transcription antitermination factor YqgF
MKYLGLDFGQKHLGLAIADGLLAEPYGEKANNAGAIKYLKNLIVSESIDKIVIGLPEGKLSSEVKKFGGELYNLTGKEVVYHDETLSTQEARQKLIEAGKPQLKRRLDHRAAAALILQDFLDIMGEGG